MTEPRDDRPSFEPPGPVPPPPPPGPDAAPPPYGPPPGPPPYGGPYGGPQGGGVGSADDTTWALLAYLGQFVVGFVAPLVVYLARRDRSPFVRFHGAQALNLALTELIVFAGGLALALGTLGFGLIVVIPVIIGMGVAHVVYMILAAMGVGRRELYRIPAWLCWPMVR